MLTFSLFTYTSNAQTYVPFPTGADTAVWFVSSSYWVSGSGQTSYYNIVTDGDTIFDGLEYTKLYHDDNGTLRYYYAAIREENKIIYLRDFNDNTWGVNNISSDTILFDFNVQVGDTINWFSFGSGPMEVYSIDSVQVADGTYRKRFSFSGPGGFASFQVVEGIGSNLGFIHIPLVGGGGTYTNCYFLNGDFVWTSWFGGTANDCYTSTTQLNSNSKITVNPNPTSDNLNIEFENTEQRELMIFNQLGQVVLNEISNETTVILNLEQLPKGFYVLTIRTHESIFTKKIIKN